VYNLINILALKKHVLFFILFFAAITSRAQVDVNYTQFAVGAGASYIRGYTNLNIQQNHFAENVNFTYYYTGYIPITAEIQSGTLSGGSVTLDPYGRQYTNNYLAMILHGDFQFGQITDPDNFFKDFYVGTGVGVISDNDKVQRTSPADPGYVFPGKDQSLNLMVPLRVGYEYKILNSFDEPFIRLSISYEHNVVFGQGLDGYDDPSSKFKHNFPAQYRQISFGIKFDFGSRGD
jgi:hypothetical protein